MIMGFILIAFFLAVSIALINGKLSFLVDGYNSVNELDKNKYDERKVCKETGFELLFADIVLMVVMVLLNTDYGKSHSAAIGLISAVIIVALTFGNVLITRKNKERYYKDEFKTKKD
ncbi:DUF3784 domain-containing protein [Clostridium fungisolvens]|uniref:DUF3784 domain-containing protein n=1 Tax=Clostridium fungisolvens TaxID=1604897 RepID=A0A6V8SF48_9CLOT|nr:DUF3784 domain-containing protein [Clostridium fungisolvens]GFP75839.1 hypothetical protein bsdtw1_01931 [Clostridium fungisolvens]